MSYPSAPAPGNPPPTPTPPASAVATQQHPSPDDASLQFDRADFGTTEQPAASTCSACHQPITGTYYAAGEHVVCPGCRDQIRASMTGGSGGRRFFRALLFGVAAGAAGALLWYVVTKLTGFEIGLIAIVVGFVVGTAVRKGSDNRGGVAYQILAVVITYCCIVSTYVPELYGAAAKEPGDAPAWFLMAFAIVIAFMAPVLMGFKNIIGLLIIGFALWEAGKINKYRPVEFSGPFTIGGGAGGAVIPAASLPPLPVPPVPAPHAASTNRPSPPPPQLGMT